MTPCRYSPFATAAVHVQGERGPVGAPSAVVSRMVFASVRLRPPAEKEEFFILQPRHDPAQQPPVAYAPGNGPHRLAVRSLAEIVRQDGVHHLTVPGVQQAVHTLGGGRLSGIWVLIRATDYRIAKTPR